MKRFLYKNIFPAVALFVLNILYKSYKVRIVNPEIEAGILERGHRPIYISWHQRFLPGIFYLSQRKPIAIMVSMSKDGDLVSGIIEKLGWQPVRGSSSRGGTGALKKIIDLMNSGYSVGHIVDGPKGPFGEIKPGVLLAAKMTGMPLLPVIISADKKWIFNSWDRFFLPKPFSMITIKFEEEIYVSEKSTAEDIEKYRNNICEKLMKYYANADAQYSC